MPPPDDNNICTSGKRTGKSRGVHTVGRRGVLLPSGRFSRENSWRNFFLAAGAYAGAEF